MYYQYRYQLVKKVHFLPFNPVANQRGVIFLLIARGPQFAKHHSEQTRISAFCL
jgi:hypothetical protein